MKKVVKFILYLLSIFGLVSVANAYVVNSGDTLSKIAKNTGISVQELIKINPQVKNPNLIFPGEQINTGEQKLGAATSPVAGQTYYLSGSGVTASASSITLQSLKIPQTGYKLQDSDFSDTFYVTMEPGNTKKQEITACTTVTQNVNGTATISGCSRGMLPFSPFTASSTYAFSHGGGTSLIFSNPPQLLNEYPAKGNDESVSGLWTYTNANGLCFINSNFCLRSNSSSLQWTQNGWVDSYNFTSTSITQLVPSTTQGLGTTNSQLVIRYRNDMGLGMIPPDGKIGVIVNTSTAVEVDSNGIKINTSTLVSLIATSTPTANKIPIANSLGKIDTSWLGPTSTGVDGSLNIPSGTVTLNDSAKISGDYAVYNYTTGSIALAGTLTTGANLQNKILVLKFSGDCDIAGTIDLSGKGGAGGAVFATGTPGAGTPSYTAGTPGVTSGNPGVAGSSTNFTYYDIYAGSGGGGGFTKSYAGGPGGAGGGAIIVYCNGKMTFSGTLNLKGIAGTDATNETVYNFLNGDGGSGGGGGGGGMGLFLANSFGTSTRYTVTTTGGLYGNGSRATGVTGGGPPAQNAAGGAGGGASGPLAGYDGLVGGSNNAPDGTQGRGGKGADGRFFISKISVFSPLVFRF